MPKLMLVEDDNNLREIYEARLQAEGYTIVKAHDGEEALVVAKAEKPDLIISDVMMPKISGFEMLDILRNTEGLKDVKVIMLTALGQSDDQQRAGRLGADRYLVKSQVTLEDIVKATHELLSDNSAGAATTAAAPTASDTTAAAAAPPQADSSAPAATPPATEPATPPAVTPSEPAATPIAVTTPDDTTPPPAVEPQDSKPQATPPPVTPPEPAAPPADEAQAPASSTAIPTDIPASSAATSAATDDENTAPSESGIQSHAATTKSGPDPIETMEGSSIGSKKVIQPLADDPNKKDITTLAAIEEAESEVAQSLQTPNPPSTAVVMPSQPPTVTDPTGVTDPNNITL